MIKRRNFILLPLIIASMNNAIGQDRSLKTRESLQLVHADSLEMRLQGNEEILTLYGDVKMVQGEAFLNCQNATWWKQRERMLLLEDVHIYDGKRDLRADRVEYDGKMKIERAQGHVGLEFKDRSLKADQMTYMQESEEIFAKGNIRFLDWVEQTILKGDECYYNRTTDYGWIKGHSQIVKLDSASTDSMMVMGLKIEAWGEEQVFAVTDSVILKKGSLKAQCKYARYQSKGETLQLEQAPVLWHQNHEMKGDTITLKLQNLHFQGGTIRRHAQIISRDSTAVNELKGSLITVEAEKDTIRTIHVSGQASSIYHISDEESKEEGINTVTGDRIVIHFKGDEINRVSVGSEPGQSKGTYKPKEQPVRSESAQEEKS